MIVRRYSGVKILRIDPLILGDRTRPAAAAAGFFWIESRAIDAPPDCGMMAVPRSPLADIWLCLASFHARSFLLFVC